jgi:hypothetical protein
MKHIKNIKRYTPKYTEYTIFEVIFNPQFKKTQKRYSILTETISSVTLGHDKNLYINFNDANVEDTSIFDIFAREASAISYIEIKIGDKEGNITDKRLFPVKFKMVMPTAFSYDRYESFLAVFNLDIKRLR